MVILFSRLGGSVGEHHWRSPTNLDFAADSWRELCTRGFFPPLLLPFGYSSHCYVFVELADADQPGGSVFTGSLDGSELVREFDDLSGYVATIAISLEEYAKEGGTFDGDDALKEQWAIAPGHKVYDARRRFDTELHEWPPHWKVADGFDAEAEKLKGSTHTIDEVIALRRARKARPFPSTRHTMARFNPLPCLVIWMVRLRLG